MFKKKEKELKELATQISELAENPLYKDLIQLNELQDVLNKDLIERVQVLEAEVEKLKNNSND